MDKRIPPIGGEQAGNGSGAVKRPGSDGPVSKHVAKRQKKKLKKKRAKLAPVVASLPIEKQAGDHEDLDDLTHTGSAPDLDVPECPADVFAWMITPVSPEDFFSKYWEKKPLLIRRNGNNSYAQLFGTEVIDQIIRKNHLKYGVNLDITSYVDGQRETHNPDGRVLPNVTWAMYEDGCSLRMLNPHTYHKPLWHVVARLQEYFGTMVGINTYLTPADSQGFAPHYDDIEAFILQVEGSKRWRLYDNPTGEKLPRFSSENFDQRSIGAPLLDVVLHEGDLLYFPRGIVHQAVSVEEEHSLHLTVSTYQLTDWAQYFQKLVPKALQLASSEIGAFREGLPRQYLSYMGLVHEDKEDERRKAFVQHAKKLFSQMAEVAPFDAAADDMALQFLHDSMPPCLSEEQKALSATSKPTQGMTHPPVTGNTMVKLVSPLCARLVIEEDAAVVYHNVHNAMYYHGEEPQSIEFPIELAPSIEHILTSDDFVRVDDLPDNVDVELRQDLVVSLFDNGLLLRKEGEAEDDSDGE